MSLGVYFPPGYGTFTMNWDCADSNYNASCTVAFRNIPDYSAIEANAALQPCWYNGGRPSGIGDMSDQWTNVSTYCLVQKFSHQLSDLDPLGTVGLDTDPCPSSANTVVVRKITGYAGKRQRGRMAFPPFLVNEALVDSGGHIDPTLVAGMQTRFTAALDAMAAASLPMVLMHTQITVDDFPTPTPVLQLDVQATMGIQRKRQRR